MKAAKKNNSALRKPGRPSKPENAVERQMVGTRLSPTLYEKLVNAAAENGRSISAEMEKRVESSFDYEATRAGIGHRLMEAFEAPWMEPPEEWIKDPLAYQAGIIRALEVMLAWHPAPSLELYTLLLVGFRARLEEHLLAVKGIPDEGLTLPALDWRSSRRQRKPITDTTNNKKVEDQ